MKSFRKLEVCLQAFILNTLNVNIPIERHTVYNRELKFIKKEFMFLYKQDELDGFCTYLYGIILGQTEDFRLDTALEETLKETENIQQRNVYIEAIQKYPWNWSAWLDLTTTISDSASIQRVSNQLPDHLYKSFWTAHAYLEMQLAEHAMSIYEVLGEQFPSNNYIKAQRAVAAYLDKDFNLSNDLFYDVHACDPYRLENMDSYSNVLYVRNDTSNLSILAHEMMGIEKYSAETCCVIGNYYSIKSDHEKALIYFERAIKLNPRHLNAWILSGHEYLEMKNIAAANAAFRKALDINSRDYRAWYNLGHTYELFKLPQYALYYYSKASELCKNDTKVWEAMGDCFLDTNQEKSAEMCFKRVELLKQNKALKE